MKKIISLILITIMSLNLVACGGDVKVQKASDEEKQAVIIAAQKCLDSDEFKSAVELYETTFETESNTPEIINALTFKYDDYEGMAVDFILFNVKVIVASSSLGNIPLSYKSNALYTNSCSNAEASGLLNNSVNFAVVEERLSLLHIFNTFSSDISNFLSIP